MGLFGWRKKKEPVTFSSFEDFMENMPKGTTVDEETLRLMAMHQTYHKYVYDEQYVTRGSKLACTQGTRASLIDLPLDIRMEFVKVHWYRIFQKPVICRGCRQTRYYLLGRRY